jgi:hypothetical protein
MASKTQVGRIVYELLSKPRTRAPLLDPPAADVHSASNAVSLSSRAIPVVTAAGGGGIKQPWQR